MQRHSSLTRLLANRSLATTQSRAADFPACLHSSAEHPALSTFQQSDTVPEIHIARRTQSCRESSARRPGASIVDAALNLPPIPGQRRVKTRGVVINDLQATVAAQVQANRNPPIRRTISPFTEANVQEIFDLQQKHDGSGMDDRKTPNNKITDGKTPGEYTHPELKIKHFGVEGPHSRCPSRYPIGTWSLSYYSSETLNDELERNQRRPYNHLLDTHREYDSLERLDAEINAFDTYMQLSPLEAAAVQGCIDVVMDLVTKALPSTSFVMHGSRSTGLADPLSNIDFCVLIPEYEEKTERGPSPSRPQAKKAARAIFRRLQEALREHGRFKDVCHRNGHADLLTATDKPTGLAVQFVANMSVARKRELSTYYLEEYPQLRPLFMVVHQALRIRGLDSLPGGGIGSYPLLVMILTALKHSNVAFRKEDLGLQLLHILNFWAHAETDIKGYAADPPRAFLKFKGKASDIMSGTATSESIYDKGFKALGETNSLLRKRNHNYQSNLLCLQDPGNPAYDLGKRTHHIKLIQEVFQHALEKIKLSCTEYNNITVGKGQGDGGISLIGPLVEARYDSFVKARTRLSQVAGSYSG